jgi:hypothetical protein
VGKRKKKAGFRGNQGRGLAAGERGREREAERERKGRHA